MKKFLVITTMLILAGMCKAHAGDLFMPNAIIYENTTTPYSKYFDGSVKPVKRGEAQCKNFLAILSIGKCGINDAMADGDITKVNSIDKVTKNILFYQKVKVVVYGE